MSGLIIMMRLVTCDFSRRLSPPPPTFSLLIVTGEVIEAMKSFFFKNFITKSDYAFLDF